MVFTLLMLVTGAPPTSAALMPPLPFSPWHSAHFCAKIGAPCAGVPLPGGSPRPSGRMLMSQGASSASPMGWPRPGPAANPVVIFNISKKQESLGINMPHPSRSVDRPARRAVVVLARKPRDRRRLQGLAADGDDLGARRLHVPRLVPGAALQHRRSAVPVPGDAKARERLGEHRLLQRPLRPARAAVGRHHHFRDPPL